MTIYDIAEEAGVSITTVSRVLNNHRNVSARTLEKVNYVLEKNHYRPNLLARGLVIKSTGTIGVMTVDIRHSQYAAEAFVVEQELERLGYAALLCNTGYDPEAQIKYLKLLVEKRVDGLMLVGSVFHNDRIDEGLRRLAAKIPVMMINGALRGPNIYSVISDNGLASRHAAEHLISRGRRRICYFRDSPTYSTDLKIEGYRAALRAAGIPEEDGLVIRTDNSLEGGARGVDELAARKIRFDAIMTGEDITAAGALNRLRELGFKVPKRVSVVGFDNTVLSRCVEPRLTTVDTKVVARLTLAVKLLRDAIAGERVDAQTYLVPDLVVRKSS